MTDIQEFRKFSFASKIVFDKLSKGDRELIKKAAKDSVEFQKTEWKAMVKKSEDKVRAAGCTITELKDNSEFQNAMKPLYDSQPAEIKEVVEKIRAVK